MVRVTNCSSAFLVFRLVTTFKGWLKYHICIYIWIFLVITAVPSRLLKSCIVDTNACAFLPLLLSLSPFPPSLSLFPSGFLLFFSELCLVFMVMHFSGSFRGLAQVSLFCYVWWNDSRNGDSPLIMLHLPAIMFSWLYCYGVLMTKLRCVQCPVKLLLWISAFWKAATTLLT